MPVAPTKKSFIPTTISEFALWAQQFYSVTQGVPTFTAFGGTAAMSAAMLAAYTQFTAALAANNITATKNKTTRNNLAQYRAALTNEIRAVSKVVQAFCENDFRTTPAHLAADQNFLQLIGLPVYSFFNAGLGGTGNSGRKKTVLPTTGPEINVTSQSPDQLTFSYRNRGRGLPPGSAGLARSKQKPPGVRAIEFAIEIVPHTDRFLPNPKVVFATKSPFDVDFTDFNLAGHTALVRARYVGPNFAVSPWCDVVSYVIPGEVLSVAPRGAIGVGGAAPRSGIVLG